MLERFICRAGFRNGIPMYACVCVNAFESVYVYVCYSIVIVCAVISLWVEFFGQFLGIVIAVMNIFFRRWMSERMEKVEIDNVLHTRNHTHTHP